MKGLEIGGELHPAYPDYDQLDNVPHWGADIVADARHLPIGNGTYEHVYARNVLEHFSWRETEQVLQEWLRVVTPDGLLEVVVPDVIGIINDYLSGKDEWKHCVERIAGTQDYEGNTHLAFFTYNEFEKLLPEGVEAEIIRTHLGGGITVRIRRYLQED